MDPFALPDELPTDTTSIGELITAAQAEFDALYDDATADGAAPTSEQLERLTALTDAIDRLDAHHASITAEQEARRATAAELATRARRETSDEADNNDPAPADDNSDPAGASHEEAPAEPELVAASATPTTRRSFAGVGRASGSNPAAVAPRAEMGLLMAPGAHGYTPGRVGFDTLARALDSIRPGSTVRAQRQFVPTAAKQQGLADRGAASFAMLPRDFPDELRATDPHSLVAAVEAATNPASLTAAAGWCAPSDRMYDFLDVPDASGLLSIPEVSITRGGVLYPAEPDFWTLYQDTDSFFHFTETELTAEPEPTKPCYEVDCDDTFDEHRLEVIGFCLTAGILQKKGWPERVEKFLRMMTKAHLHRLSAARIAKIVAGSTAVTIPAATTIGAYASFINSIEFQANQHRLREALPEDHPIEGFAPYWAKAALRADLNMRSGYLPNELRDAQINEALADRGVRLQWVGDWQVRTGGLPGDPTATSYPTTVDVVLYPAGTWFSATEDVIEIGGLYDKAQLQANRYTELFTEDAFLVGKRGLHSTALTIPLAVNGQVGERTLLGNDTAAAAAV